MNIKNKLILKIEKNIKKYFEESDWKRIGLLTNTINYINNHDRLLKSLSWKDNDYPTLTLDFLFERTLKELDVIQKYISDNFTKTVESQDVILDISNKQIENRKLTFAPNHDVFSLPEDFEKIEEDLVAVMMPFTNNSNSVLKLIEVSAEQNGLRAETVKGMFDNPTIIQNIFALILKSKIVIADITDSNPNVIYELGIAHTLGKIVILIAKSDKDLKFNFAHHHTIIYGDDNAKLIDRLDKALAKYKQNIY